MNKQMKKRIQHNVYDPANRFMDTVAENPVTSIAALATLGVGMAFVLTDKNYNIFSSSHQTGAADKQPSAERKTYFDAAPRSISGRHHVMSEDSGGAMMKKGAPLLIGSAALLTGMYLYGKRKI